MVLNYTNDQFQTFADTVKVVDGNFQFTGLVKGAQYAYLQNIVDGEHLYGAYDRYIFISPGTILVSFTYGNLGSGIVTGSAVQQEADALNLQKSSLLKQLQPLRLAMDSLKALLSEGKLNEDTASSQLAVLAKKTRPIYDSAREMDIHYIIDHSHSFLSLNILMYQIGRVSNDSIDHLYALLADDVRNSSEGHVFNKYYNDYKTALTREYAFASITLNEPAPAFSIYKNREETRHLKDFSGKIILLEFWETTCFPCLISNPQIELLRKKYEANGLIVIGITTEGRSQTAALNKYIKNNRFHKWLHVHESKKELNPELWRGDFSRYHNIEVPRTVLIDGKGILVYKALGYQIDDISKLEAAIISSLNKEEEALTSD